MHRKAVLVVAIIGFIGTAIIHGFPFKQKEEGKVQRQKEHGKLYKTYSTGKKLRDVVKTAKGDVGLNRRTPFRGSGGHTLASLPELLQPTACKADAIVIGTVASKTSLLTEDEEYIFTDYDVNVEEVLKHRQVPPIQIHDHITVTRPGGEIQIDGKKVVAVDESFQPLEANKRYLLLLELIPLTGAYRAVNDSSSFLLQGDRVINLSTSIREGLLENESPQLFADIIRQAVTTGCEDGEAK